MFIPHRVFLSKHSLQKKSDKTFWSRLVIVSLFKYPCGWFRLPSWLFSTLLWLSFRAWSFSKAAFLTHVLTIFLKSGKFILWIRFSLMCRLMSSKSWSISKHQSPRSGLACWHRYNFFTYSCSGQSMISFKYISLLEIIIYLIGRDPVSKYKFTIGVFVNVHSVVLW